MTSKSEMAARLASAGAFLPGKRVKIDFGRDGIILLDGVAGQVTETDGDADATVSLTWDDWLALSGGQLNPMSAFMSGKLRVAGDMSVAMQLQGLLGKLAG